MKFATKTQIDEISLTANAKLKEILETESCYPKDSTTYYVDCLTGNDDNDGLSADKPFKTTNKISDMQLNYGDVVLFRRGQIFRGLIKTQPGVTYSAYGEGKKPEFYGSVSASDPSDWVKTEFKNVWRYKEPIHFSLDIGAIFMKNETLWGIKVCVNTFINERCDMGKNMNTDVFNGRQWVHRERSKWNGIEDLKGDLEFYHDWKSGYVYLNCPDGNPAEAFGTVEMTQRISIVRPKEWGQKDVTLDNLCFKYGNFGVSGFGDSTNFTVRNCIFGCIGGSSQFVEKYINNDQNIPYGDDVTRLGNGVEIYGVCENFIIENCYFYQNYDAAVTVQVSYKTLDRDRIMNGITWRNNLFDACHYPFELWLYSPEETAPYRAAMVDVDISGNIVLGTGYGFGHTRRDPGDCFLYSGWEGAANCEFINCNMHDNILFKARTSNYRGKTLGEEGIKFFNNKIYSNAPTIACTSENFTFRTGKFVDHPLAEEYLNKLYENGIWGKNEFYRIPCDDSSFESLLKK